MTDTAVEYRHVEQWNRIQNSWGEKTRQPWAVDFQQECRDHLKGKNDPFKNGVGTMNIHMQKDEFA